MSRQGIKTEHAGAKNGGGFYGLRADAKRVSRKLRRQQERHDRRTARLSSDGPVHDVASFFNEAFLRCQEGHR